MFYDFKDAYTRLDRTNPDTGDIIKYIEEESGSSDEAFRRRSALSFAKDIKAPTLLLHGADDDRSPVDGVRRFAEALERNGTPVILSAYPNTPHSVPIAERDRQTDAFLDRWFKR